MALRSPRAGGPVRQDQLRDAPRRRRDGSGERATRPAPGTASPAPRAQPLLRCGQAAQGISHREHGVRRTKHPGGRIQKEEEVMAVVDQPAPAVEAPAENVLTSSGLTGETLTLKVLKGVPGGEQSEVEYDVPVVTG